MGHNWLCDRFSGWVYDCIMKSTHVVFLSVFVSCMIWGFWTGANLRQSRKDVSTGDISLSSEVLSNALQNDQHNILIITIDRQDQAKPVLSSAWIMTYFFNNPSISFKPIYPTLNDNSIITDPTLTQSFQIISVNSHLRLIGSFLNTLSQRNLWWNGYIIIDRQVLPQLLNIKNPPQSYTSKNLRGNNQYQPSSTNNDLLNIYEEDTLSIKYICNELATNHYQPSWDLFRDMVPKYLDTDMDAEILIDEWETSLNNNDQSVCILPLEVLVPMRDVE